MVCVARHAQSTKNNKFAISLEYFKWVLKFIYGMQVGIKISFKLILWFVVGMVKHYQSSQNSKSTSLQYLRNMSEMKLSFCVQININVTASWQYRFCWKWPGISKVPKVLLLWCKTFRYFTRVQSCLLLLVIFKTSCVFLNSRFLFNLKIFE